MMFMFVTAVNIKGQTMHLNVDQIVIVYETDHNGEPVVCIYLANGGNETFRESEAEKFLNMVTLQQWGDDA